MAKFWPQFFTHSGKLCSSGTELKWMHKLMLTTICVKQALACIPKWLCF